MNIHLHGPRLTLRAPTETDLPTLLDILRRPEIAAHWSEPDDEFDSRELLGGDSPGNDNTATPLAIVGPEGVLVGWIQFYEHNHRDYRFAGLDLFIAPQHQRRGYAVEAIRLVCRYLLEERQHHRLVIDPAADNKAAIAAYEKIGFRPVGIMRRYERGPDGRYHDGLLMDLLADELR